MDGSSGERCVRLRDQLLESIIVTHSKTTSSSPLTPSMAALARLLTALPHTHILCSPCAALDRVDAYLAIDPLRIILCQEHIKTSSQLRKLLIHELIHAYDLTTQNADLYSCEGLAYSEVRAARAGNCSDPLPFEWLRKDCIKQHAIASTAVCIEASSSYFSKTFL